ncbi:hypothetical protein [Mesobacillus campisalis]|uniref:hypothetical protein n=1 Tax=Mesobacillus campisalis TaxID=1408103 RepID=UPI000A416EF3|nr:hypothetical protein [Mesobacillus campisalis]
MARLLFDYWFEKTVSAYSKKSVCLQQKRLIASIIAVIASINEVIASIISGIASIIPVI